MAENVVEQTNEKEFSQEDISSVKDLQTGYARVAAQIGQTEIELHLLKQRLEKFTEFRGRLFEEYAKLQTQEQELIDSLNSKYGDGVLDLDSGKFIPTKS